MTAKLSEITTQYHTFVDNQVLTKDQLNEFISYFEDQDRMSRVFLTGIGIVCGFKVEYTAKNHVISISQGTGITTDGDLLKLQAAIPGSAMKSIGLEKIDFAWVKKFEDNFANYHFFKRLVSVGKKFKDVPIEMWEILPAKTENVISLGTLPGIEKMMVLLYLESFPKEGDLCTAIDCDNQGVEQVARLRVLLVSQTDAEYILGLDSLFTEHNKINEIIGLPEVAVCRVVLNQTNTTNYDELKKAYYTALSADNLISNLSEGIKTIVTDFQKILGLKITPANLDVYLAQLKNVAVFKPYNVPFNVQYRYDCVKDIVDTYNDIRELLMDLKNVCNPDITAFPKHLMLGSLAEIGNEIQNYRHGFYKSPVMSCGKDIKHCHSLVLRLFQLISGFKTLVGEVKITPSNKLSELSNKSIPFYYEVDVELLKNWDFSKTVKLKYNTNLGYHRKLLSATPQIQEPLNFNTDKFDFYRIEGHQGKDYKTALEEIDNLKVKHGLAFDVKALSLNINQETLNIDDYTCEFEDLNVLLKAWTAEQDCVLAQVSQFFSGYSLAEPGVNIRESAIDINRGIVTNLANGRILENTSTLITGSSKEIQSKTIYYQPVINIKSNVIAENLTTGENTLGEAMKIALEDKKDGSVNDIIARAGMLIVEKINTEVWKDQTPVKDLVIDKSIELMAYSHVLARKMPGSLTHVSVEAVADYKITLKELCALVDRLKKIYQTVQLSASQKALMGVLITQLSSVCCSAKKLEVLLDEINKRKENIIVRLKLSKFVEKYPGLEHHAGVEPGGTFFLVYLNKTNVTTRIAAADVTGKASPAFVSELEMSRITLKSDNILNLKDNELKEMLLNEKTEISSRLELLNRVIKITDIPNNTVVADFSLPYKCCSNCAPINFIIEKPPVSLRLPTDHFCLGKDSSPLTFEVSPIDGVIKANPEIAGMKIEGTKLSFDAAVFPNDMLGQTIKFTVNDQITTCEIKVYRAVKFDFKVPESPTSQTEITFIPEGKLDGASFLWSFGDDNLSTERNPTHKYILPVNNENKVTVSLTVTAANGVCRDTVEHDITFVREETKIVLESVDFCENDRKTYPFKVTPDGAKVKIEGSGVQSDNSGGFIFMPALAGAGIFEFLLNGEPSGLKVTVHKAPVASFKSEQVGNQLVLTNTSTHAESFVWFVNGDKIEKNDTSSVTIDLTRNSPNSWKIQLQASNKFCGSVTSPEVIFTTRFIEEPTGSTCIEETKASVLTDAKALTRYDLATSNHVHPVWLETSKIYGGTREFNDGVLNDIDNFLSGKNNDKILVMFEKLLNATVEQILSLHPLENKDEFDRLVQIFRLQLQLFYNILGCQDAAIIKEFSDALQPLLDFIIELLHALKDKQVEFPTALREFMKNYAEKVKNLELLVKHLKVIQSKNLI